MCFRQTSDSTCRQTPSVVNRLVVSVWVTFFAALLILPILFGALIAGYSAFSEVDGSEALLPPAFWILIAAGGALGGYIGVKVGVVRGSALDYRL
ncbi:putative membrane protein YfhO [Rhodococcus sp. 27YEA6]